MGTGEKAGVVATESLLVTVATRHLQPRFGGLKVHRGDGSVRFDLGTTFENDKQLVDVVEKTLVAALKELTGKQRAKHPEFGDMDFTGLRESVLSFPEMMQASGGAAVTMLSSLDSIPLHAGVVKMINMLYGDAVTSALRQTCIGDFPRQLCLKGLRFDVAMGGSLLASGYSEQGPELESGSEATDSACIVIESRSLAVLLSAVASTPVQQQLPEQWRQKTFALEETDEMLVVVFRSLKFFWNSSSKTEKSRVSAASLLGIVSGELRDYLREQILLESADVAGPWRMNRLILQRCAGACEKWTALKIALVSGGEWEEWDGGSCDDAAFDDFRSRLSSASTLRAVVEHANTLVSRGDLHDVDPERIFDGLWLTDSRKTPQSNWKAACDKFEKNFSVLESHLIGKLRQQWSSTHEGGVGSLSRYAEGIVELLQRETIARALESELGALATALRQDQHDVQKRHSERQRKANNPFESLVACRNAMAELAPIADSAQRILGQTTYVKPLLENGGAIAAEVKETQDGILSRWKAHVVTRVESLCDGAVVSVAKRINEADAEAPPRLTVVVNTEATSTLDEVRVMLGMHRDTVKSLPTDVIRTLEDVNSLVRQSLRMNQVAAMYNGLSNQILTCTRSMLRDLMQRCETTVIPSGQMVRGFPASGRNELEAVLSKLQASVEQLAKDNRSIRRFHAEMTSSVSSLFSVDLLNNQDQWKSILVDMRDRLSHFKEINSFTSMDTWKRHWDYQLYKALEHQYRRGLESLNESVQPFSVELVFKQGSVAFKPGFESLREKYYDKIRSFISIPNRFKGVGGSDFFAQMPSRNAASIAIVHQKAMELFSKLTRVKKQFRDLVIVGHCGMHGAFDLDLIVNEFARGVDQWQAGLKLVKQRMSMCTAIEDKITVDCIEVSTVPVKATIEDHVKKLEDALVNSMRRAAQKRLAEVDAFTLFASNIIERHPTSLEEVGQANKAYQEFEVQLPAMKQKLAEQDELQKLLKSSTGATVDMALTKSRWDHLLDAMASHHKQLDASVEKMRSSVDAVIQKFLKDVQRFADSWNKHKPKDVKTLIGCDKKAEQKKPLLLKSAHPTEGESEKTDDARSKALNYIKDRVLEMEELVQSGVELEEKCKYFRVHSPDLGLLRATESDVKEASQMWKFFEEFDLAVEQLRSEDWLTFRTKIYRFEDLMKDWSEKLHDPSVGLSPQCLVAEYIDKQSKEWLDVLPLFKFVRGDGYLAEHWNEVFRMLEVERGITSDKLLFGHLLEKGHLISANESELKQLHGRAQGEVQIRDALQELRTWSLDANFTLVAPSEGTTQAQVMLITEWKEVLSQVSDYQALLASLKDSQYYVRFADEAGLWEQKLLFVNDCMLLLNNIQRRWVYLEPLFARGALPHEAPRFRRVDKEFVGILRDVEADPRVMSLAAHSDYQDKLKSILEQIERCQKALNEFLEQKRDKFPRFYFISDEDLLEILGQSKNPLVIQSHLKKLFGGINSVKFNEEKSAIQYVLSSDGECVALSQAVPITANDVEDWLIELDRVMRVTLKTLLEQCVDLPSCTSVETIDKYPSQVLQTAEQIIFTRQIENDGFRGSGMSQFRDVLHKKLDELTGMDLRGDKVRELKVKALIMDLIHSIDVVDLLAKNGTKNANEWQWQKQLRYYFEKSELRCFVRMGSTQFDYTFEYQGNAAKLVHTPLTDRCYLTLTKGMALGFGGNLYGPAGTGKTESVKALGGALGRQVLVFNCDEGIDFKAMGRIFVGIVKCGAWGCFDEFNRLKVDQLSAISQMIQVIQEALKRGEPNCTLLGRLIDVNAASGIFVTLNPAGKGYGGRSKLPDNLKLLFRAVAMSVPNSDLITATMLLSEGFKHAKALAPKVVEVYRLSKQLLSPQQHYDWGLRPLKAVLRLGGSLVQALRDGDAAARTEVAEGELMVQSLRVNTLSKLTFDDARLFNGIIADIFPGVTAKDVSYEQLDGAVRQAISALKLQVSETQIHKVTQLYEAMNQRMGVVLVGPSGSGKSTLLRILRKALQTLGTEVPLHAMNPKALPRQQLLGHMDVDTREWFDGVLSAAARTVVKQPLLGVKSWIFCDGDIDPEWVESLNSVLDDNKLLTMPNGVRIQFGSNVNFVFETHSLQFASPATVSRMGIIFLSEEDVKPKYVVASYPMTDAQRSVVDEWIDAFLFKAIDLAISKEQFSVETTRMALLSSCLTHVVDSVNKMDFCVSVVRAICGFLEIDVQNAVALELFEIMGEKPIDSKNPLSTFVDRTRSKTRDISPQTTTIDAAALISGSGSIPMVGTIEVQRTLLALRPFIESDTSKPFFLVGPEGCGKALILANCFSSLRSVKVAVINCSAQTSSAQVIQKIQQLCSVYSTPAGKVLRPKEAERLVLVFKDINLPKPDKYGTVMLHSLLQQLLLYSGFYDSDLEWVGVERVQIVGSMNAEESPGRFPLSPRLLAIVNIVTMGYPDNSSLMMVYSALFSALLKTPKLRDGRQFDNGRELAMFVTTVYGKLKRRFSGEEYRFCIFSPRDVTAWALSILRYGLGTSTGVPEVLSYEASRIFSDRLPRNEDRTRAERILTEQLATIGFAAKREERAEVIFSAVGNEWIEKSTPADGLQAPPGTRQLSVSSVASMTDNIEKSLVGYAREFGELEVSLIPELIHWFARVERALCAPAGHVLLTGRSGVGRRATVTLVCYQLKVEVVRLNMGREYGKKHFAADMKSIISRATTQNERLCLIVEDHNFVEEGYLEMLNSLIASGEIPGLFTNEELDAILGPLREDASAEGAGIPVYQFFLNRLRANLRIALLMDQRHPLYAVRCQSNPALLTRCNVLWIDTLSVEGMRQLSTATLKDIAAEVAAAAAGTGDRLDIPKELMSIHGDVGDRATPQLFSNLMVAYASIYEHKKKVSHDAVERLATGLGKLIEAEEQVDGIQRDVAKKKTDMEAKQKELDEAMNDIEANMADAAEQRTKAEDLSKRLDEEQVVIAEKSEKVETELSGITPMLEAAKEAISGIKTDNLREISALKMPPEAIRDVLEGVLGLLGTQDTSWQSMRMFLKSSGVKDRIVQFDANTVSPKIRDSVAQLLKQRANSFKHETIVRASVAAAPMAAWVKANVEFATVNERIDPLRTALEELQQNKARSEEKLVKTQSKLKKIDEKLATLKKDFSTRCKEAEKLKDALEKAEQQLERANSLLSELSGEKQRWSTQTADIEADARSMPRKAIMCAAFMTYLGQESEDVRRGCVSKWGEKLGVKAESVDFSSYMRSEAQLLKFKAEGLPGDALSMENAVMMLDTRQTPLVIDPANQAIEWLAAHLKANDITVETLSISDERFAHSLELAIRFGKTLLVTEVDRIEPLLFPVLRRDLQSLGPKKVVQLGAKQVDWQETFRIFLFTRSTDLVLPPNAASLVTEINFSVTRSGLESQLLGLTIQHEQPQMQQQKVELLQKEEALKVQLADLEESLLHDLAHSKGNLLENVNLINSLKTIKEQSHVIEKSLVESKALQVDLDQQREVFRPLAKVGSSLFFLVQDMEFINKMYRFALVVFLDIFGATLRDDEASPDVEAKMSHLSVSLTQRAFLYVSRGLFKEDRVPFAMHVARGLHIEKFPSALWDVFTGRSKATADGVEVPSWCQSNHAQVIGDMQSAVAADSEILKRWQVGDASWGDWLRDPQADETITKRLGHMDALLFVATFYREKIVPTMTRIALQLLQLPAVGEVTTIESLVPSTSPGTPILLITSAGADPSLEVQEVAHKAVGREKFTQIALGGGQTDEALQQVRRCAIQGEWCFLKNLHLVLDWVPVLEKEVCAMSNPHPDFRLWLTSEAHDLFPSVLLKSSLKMTIESPPGVQQNMLRTYGGWSSDWYAQLSPAKAQLLFSLAWFHATLAERRGFIPQGWVKFYEFTPADLRAAADVAMEISDSGPVDWVTLRGVLDDAIYGGRLDNDQDTLVLRLMLERVFNDDTMNGKKPLFVGAGPLQSLSVPAGNDYAAALQGIHQLPEMNAPVMFDLPLNADNVVQENRGAKFKGDLKTLASAHREGGSGNSDALKAMLEPVVAQVWANSPLSELRPHAPSSFAGETPDPIAVYLVSELRMMAKLVLDVQHVFTQAKHVVDGTALPGEELRRVSPALATYSTPDHWLDRMPGSESLSAWIASLGLKVQKTTEWAQNFDADSKRTLSQALNLTERFRPHTFLNALRQFTARAAAVPLADLVLCASTTPVQGTVVGVTLEADTMQLQGAQFTGGRLSTCSNETPSSVRFTAIHVAWIESRKAPHVEAGVALLPVYTSSLRELHLMNVHVPCEGQSEQWAIRGCAAFLVGAE